MNKKKLKYINRFICDVKVKYKRFNLINQVSLNQKLKFNSGFSLLELLVTLTIISIITSVAIPQYKNYKQKGYDFRAQNDLRNVAIAEEAYFIDNEEYLSCANDSCKQLPAIKSLSDGVTLSVAVNEDTFKANSTHAKGTGKVFSWDSEKGGMSE